MKINLHIYSHDSESSDDAIGRFDQLIRVLAALTAQVHAMDTATRASLDKLNAEVTRDTDLTNSIKTTLDGMAAEIAALKQGQTDPAVIAALDAAAEIVRANNDATAAAIVANTPGA